MQLECELIIDYRRRPDAQLERYVRLCSKLTQHTNELSTPSNINASSELKSDHLTGALLCSAASDQAARSSTGARGPKFRGESLTESS